MKRKIYPKICKISIRQISGIHPHAKDVFKETADNLFAARLDVFSDVAVEHLMCLHPINVISGLDGLQVIGGIRSYQMAMTRLDANDKFFAHVYPAHLVSSEIEKCALIDVIGSPLMHSFGNKTTQQLAQIMMKLGKATIQRIVPELKSIRAITRLMRVKGNKNGS